MTAYSFVSANEEIPRHQAPVAYIGIYYSRPTRLFYRDKSVENDQFGTEIRGMVNVMLENHFQYDFILDDQISRERLQTYKLVILPNVRCMSDEDIIVLKNYVRDGGTLLATYATSLYNTEG